MSEQTWSQPFVSWWRRLRQQLGRPSPRQYLIWLWRFLPYLYLLRVTLLAGALLFCFRWLALYVAPSLLLNLFDLDPMRIFYVAAAALLAAWSLLISARVTLINGGERFDVPLYLLPSDLEQPDKDAALRLRQDRPRRLTLLLWSFTAMPVIYTALQLSSGAFLYKLLAVAAGVTVAIGLLWLGQWLFCAILSPAMRDLLPQTIGPCPQPSSRKPAGQRPGRFQRWLNRVPESLGKGYLSYDDPNGVLIYPGHLFAIAMLIVSFGFYILVGIWKFLSLGVTIAIPTLAYALVLLIVLSWLFSGLTFFIDRYRVPVLVLLLIVGIATTQARASDYYYELVPQVPGTAAAPATVLNAPDQSSVIVVAANGGGIQSAAWTARVLTGLELQARKEFGPDYRGFGKSIRLISSVSGGSVGAMYVLNGYSPDGLPADDELARIVEQAETSSLDAVAWGIAYPDAVRTVLPFEIVSRVLPDRGRALEAAWSRGTKLDVPLSSWRENVREGWRPAAVFNATIADTGERLLFSTSGLNHQPFRGQLFEQAYPGQDVSVVTAARLSATFPYVTPAARARTSDDLPQFHVVDGGYYDNYGMATLTEWLDQALNGSHGAIKKVLVLQIRGAPGGTDPIYRFEGDEPCPQHSDPRLIKGTRRGWFYQMYAPVSTLLNVRDTGQLAHNDVEFKLLQQVWQQRGVQIESAVFQYPGANTPLSWHLTAEQQQDIERYWAAELAGCQQQQNWTKVKQFLQGVNQAAAVGN